jgi:hypothetical protein
VQLAVRVDFVAKLILMRKVICFLFLSVLYFGAAAQAPDSLSFQAVIRDAEGSLLADQSVSARVGIYQGSEDGTKVFEETHTATTNSNGLLTLLIGGGTNLTGDLATIDWGAGPYFIKREIDPNGGTDYVISGTNQFLSVSYVLYAASEGSADNMGNHTASQDLYMNGIAITEKSSASNPLTLEVKLNDQDMQLTSYDEIYITTIEGTGNDPDGNSYATYGDIELTSADDIFLKTTGGDTESDIEITSINNILLKANDNLDIETSDNITIDATDRVAIISGTGDNISLNSANDIELIAFDDDLDFVEIWRGSTFLYTLPNVRGEIG